MREFLYLDIETIPTSNPQVRADIAASVKPPASMKKPDTIAEWEMNAKPGLVEQAVSRSALNGAQGSICCIAFAWGEETVMSCIDADEAYLLRSTFETMSSSRPQSYDRPVVVGHFVADFDLRFIWQRAVVLGIELPRWMPRDPKPWSDYVHDTMTMWAGARNSIGLDDLCKALGIEGKGDIDGSAVADLWAAGDHATIEDYCRADVVRVREIHRRMLFALGEAVA